MKNITLFQRSLSRDSSISEALELLDMDTLKGILYFIRLEHIKDCSRKEVIQRIARDLPDAAVRFLKCFDQERYSLFSKIIKQKGVLFDIDLCEEKIFAFVQIGILFPVMIEGKPALFIPKEILYAIKNLDTGELKELAAYNTAFIQKVHGLLYFYGYLTLDEMFQMMLKRNAADSIENLSFLEVIYMAVLYYGQIQPEGIGFRHKQLTQCDFLLKLRGSMKKSYPFRHFEDSSLLLAGTADYMEWTKDMQNLLHFIIKETGQQEALIRQEIEQIWFEFNNGIDLESICIMLIERYFMESSKDVKKELVTRTMQMFFTMPNWLLKGHSFEEMIRMERVAC